MYAKNHEFVDLFTCYKQIM